MSDLHKKITMEDVEKLQWCSQVALYLENFGWSFQEGYEYGEVLHYEYVELDSEYVDPIDTIKEDMTYWD